jgi:hypothetical protein
MRGLTIIVGLAAGVLMAGLCARAEDVALPPESPFNSSAGRGDIIWINLRSDSAVDYVFGVDTGATLTVLDKSWEHKLEPRPMQNITGARWPVSGVFVAPPLLLGGVPLVTGKTVVTEDLAGHFPGHTADGILGMDCLARYCVQLDFSENRIRFLDPAQPAGPELGNAIDMTAERGCFFVTQNLAGAGKYNSLIDTGCNLDGVMVPDLFRQWTSQLGTPPPAGEARFPDGVFGGVTYSSLFIASDGEQTLIGLHFLARNLVTLNFPRRKLYLQQRTPTPLPGDDGYFSKFYKTGFQTN